MIEIQLLKLMSQPPFTLSFCRVIVFKNNVFITPMKNKILLNILGWIKTGLCCHRTRDTQYALKANSIY